MLTTVLDADKVTDEQRNKLLQSDPDMECDFVKFQELKPYLEQLLRISKPLIEPTTISQVSQFRISGVEDWKKVWCILESKLSWDPKGCDEANHDEDDKSESQPSQGQSTPAVGDDNHGKTIDDDSGSDTDASMSAQDDAHKEDPDDNSKPLKQSTTTEHGDGQESILDEEDKALIDDQLQVLIEKACFSRLSNGPRADKYPPRERSKSIDNGVGERWFLRGKPGPWSWLNDLDSEVLDRWNEAEDDWLRPKLVLAKVDECPFYYWVINGLKDILPENDPSP